MSKRTGNLRSWSRNSLLAAVLLGGACQVAAGSPSTPLEARVRAAFLFNFARYTQWPPRAEQGNFTFCVVDDAAMREVLEETVAGKDVSGRPPEVRSLQQPQQGIDGCQLLYLPSLPDAELEAWLQRVADRPVLTVSEGRHFARQGGMIGFHLVERRLRFAINPGNVNQAGMQMSSRLLGLADIESGGP